LKSEQLLKRKAGCFLLTFFPLFFLTQVEGFENVADDSNEIF
jgi:hypothetical protein